MLERFAILGAALTLSACTAGGGKHTAVEGTFEGEAFHADHATMVTTCIDGLFECSIGRRVIIAPVPDPCGRIREGAPIGRSLEVTFSDRIEGPAEDGFSFGFMQSDGVTHIGTREATMDVGSWGEPMEFEFTVTLATRDGSFKGSVFALECDLPEPDHPN